MPPPLREKVLSSTSNGLKRIVDGPNCSFPSLPIKMGESPIRT
jgi:hypothetical protein